MQISWRVTSRPADAKTRFLSPSRPSNQLNRFSCSVIRPEEAERCRFSSGRSVSRWFRSKSLSGGRTIKQDHLLTFLWTERRLSVYVWNEAEGRSQRKVPIARERGVKDVMESRPCGGRPTSRAISELQSPGELGDVFFLTYGVFTRPNWVIFLRNDLKSPFIKNKKRQYLLYMPSFPSGSGQNFSFLFFKQL